MPSKIHRRSGIGFVAIAGYLKWRPNIVYQVGVGPRHEELDVIKEEWPDVEIVGCDPLVEVGIGYPGTFHNVAIGDRPGKKTIWYKPRHRNGASLFQPHNYSPDEHDNREVDVTTLDDLFSDPRESNVLLWMDCEGYELNALKGGRRFLQHVDVVNIEMTSNPRGQWCDPVDVHCLLMESGFLRMWCHTQRSAIGQADVVYVRDHLFDERYCLCPCQVMEHRKRYGDATEDCLSD